MTIDLDSNRAVQWLLEKENWEPIQTHFLMYGIRAAERYLKTYSRKGFTLMTMGSGAGFEIKALIQRLSFECILASDLSWSAAYLIGKNLKGLNGSLGLFACEFDACPVKPSPDVVCFVFEALHHSGSIYQTVDILLSRGFTTIVFVEPTRNWFVNVLDKFGLAMRVEYSGLKPDWVDLNNLNQIAGQHGYEMEYTTWWPFPDALIPKWVKKNRRLSRLLCSLVDGVSTVTRSFSFGAMSAVHMKNRHAQQ